MALNVAFPTFRDSIRSRSMEKRLSFLSHELSDRLFAEGQRAEVAKGTELLREGQYVKVVPIVLEGLVKVYTRNEDRELLLYYIEPHQSCIMSFSAVLGTEPSRIFAVAEEDSELLLIPSETLLPALGEYPDLNRLFFDQFKYRYGELLKTIHHILFDKLDVRLREHLVRKARLLDTEELAVSHQQLADELGTVREVISRTMKKLEAEGAVAQTGQRIRILKK